VDARDKSFDYARDSSKLVLTLSTGVIAFTVTFAKEIGGLSPTGCTEAILLILSWGSLFVSMVIGIWTQLAITHVLDAAAQNDNREATIWNRKIKVPFQWQLGTFLLGIAAIAFYGAFRILGAVG